MSNDWEPIKWPPVLPAADPSLVGTEYGPATTERFPWATALRVWAWCVSLGFLAGVVAWTWWPA